MFAIRSFIIFFTIFVGSYSFCNEIEDLQQIESKKPKEEQQEPKKETPPPKPLVESKCNKIDCLKDESVKTSHSININGKEIKYEATAGTINLKDDEGKIKANIFYIAYTKEGDSNPNRPITYCFNGGPGSSSVWLHLGVFGPKRVAMNDEGYPLHPYHLIENDYSILDLTDLVFIDPVSTGYSRPAPGEDPKQFHGVEEDIQYVGEFIRLYTTRNARWDSPKYLAGESYGTTRAAGLSDYLHCHYGMYFDGIILVSSVLNFQANDFNEGNDLPYILFLPTYTATAWYHKKLPPELQQADLSKVLNDVREFAMKDYTLALMQGSLQTEEGKKAIADQLSRFTGISTEFINRFNLRINIFQFVKELLLKEKRLTGRFDSRFTGIDNDVFGEVYEYDPSSEAIFGVFTSTINDYLRKDLKWEKDDHYRIIAKVHPWNYGKATNQYLYVADALRQVMSKNPRLQVFVANGYYDLATPFAATEYTFNHLGLDISLKDHVMMKYYEAGHMMYIHKPSLINLKKDLAEYYGRSSQKSVASSQ